MDQIARRSKGVGDIGEISRGQVMKSLGGHVRAISSAMASHRRLLLGG